MENTVTPGQMFAITAVALGALALFAWMQEQQTANAGPAIPDDMPDQEAGTIESALGQVQSMVGDAVSAVPDDVAQANTAAFLDMLSYSEGTTKNGYNTLFGGGTFDSLADHPRRLFSFTNQAGQTLKTTAAGRYQFLARTWDSLQAKLNLPDFGPASQDAAALELVRQRGALADVRAGRVADAIAKCAPIWASLPGAGYAQPERKLSQLVIAYQAAGGDLIA
jgi:muramidase (phage lysozyme)